MASWNVGGEEVSSQDFHAILQDEEDDLEFGEVIEKQDEEQLLEEEEQLVDEEEEGYGEEEWGEDEEYLDDQQLEPLPVTSRSPPLLLASTSTSAAAIGSGSPPVLPSDVVVTALLDDDIAIEETHVFHLADEHQLFRQEEVTSEHPQRLRLPQRGSTTQGGRGRGRRARRLHLPSSGPQWVRGDRFIEVNVNDDDVSEELREMVMRVVNERVKVTDRERRVREDNQEEWKDDDDGEVKSFFAAKENSGHFQWSPMGDYQGEREKFLPQRTGAVVASENAYEAFRQYWDDGIMSHIVTQTNRYAAGLASSSTAFARDWYDTNIHELFVLFSFWMMLGIIRMPTIKSCFTVNPLLQTNIFRKLFSRHRYENLCRALNFNDSRRPTDSNDRLYCFGPILDHLNARFKETYIPSQNICIDESLTLWKGNLSIRQYIKTKAARFGVKTFELCESSTGYLWSFFVYVGAGTSYDPGLPSNLLKSISTVLKLIRPLLDKGYTLFMDDWLNSPLLARFLKSRKTDCVGTLHANCSEVPPLVSLCNLKDGQFVARHSGDVVVLAFQDKKRKIATISTYHGSSQSQMDAKPNRTAQYKPQVILDYKKCMGGVDRKDQMLEPYLLERKRCSKWSVKFFKHLLNCSISNSRILLQSSTAAPKDHLVFRLELVDQILRHHHQYVPKFTSAQPVSSSLGHPQPLVQHFPRQIDTFITCGRRGRRRCVLCSQHNTVRRTTYVCTVCDVPLCLKPCFELYHKRFPF